MAIIFQSLWEAHSCSLWSGEFSRRWLALGCRPGLRRTRSAAPAAHTVGEQRVTEVGVGLAVAAAHGRERHVLGDVAVDVAGVADGWGQLAATEEREGAVAIGLGRHERERSRC